MSKKKLLDKYFVVENNDEIVSFFPFTPPKGCERIYPELCIKLFGLKILKESSENFYKRNFKPYGKFTAKMSIPIGRRNQHRLLWFMFEEYGMEVIHYGICYWIIKQVKKK